MGELSIVHDPATGNWFTDAGLIAPHFYNLHVRYDTAADDVWAGSADYIIKGLDFRLYPTEEAALQAAKYKLNIENPPRDITPEQVELQIAYNTALRYLDHARTLVDLGVFAEAHGGDSIDGFDLDMRRQAVKVAYEALVATGMYMAGDYRKEPPKSGGSSCC
jgi:hypothetical protein